MEEYLTTLNAAQRAAVLYTDGPQLVIAGAGSGKTRVLTHKIVHLLAKGYEPWRILALTFTNKAAREMRQRIEQLAGGATASRLWMGTFHSVFARILRAHAEKVGYKPSFTIYDAADSRSLVKMVIRDMGLDEKVYKPVTVANIISSAKNALISPEDYVLDATLLQADKADKRPLVHEVYRSYRDRCVLAGAMDFDDLLYYTNVLLRDNDDIRRHYREFFRYILVDEYQDTNFAQHMVVRQLCGEEQRLTVVGDDAQSIYSFRGASINNILDLEKSYPGLRTDKLEQNYRSTQNIVNAANSLIAKNRRQIPKKVFSELPTGDRLEVVKSFSDYEESFLVANRISQIKHTDPSDGYDEYAVLYRTNAQSRILEESLRKRNIPYRIYGGLSFYQRKEIKDAVAYMRLSLNPDDDEALRRVINYPARGIGDTTLNRLVAAAMERGCSIWHVINEPGDLAVNRGTMGKLSVFAELIASMIRLNQEGLDAYDVAETIIRRSRLLAILQSDRTPESVSKRENLEELLAGVRQYVDEARDMGQEQPTLEGFMTQVSLATDQDTKEDDDTERVTLMTVHAAKGLEFANVFIVGVEDELFPSTMSAESAAGIEEERRLLYVAITRAKKRCMLSYAGSRFRNGQTMITRPSRFLQDIDIRYLHTVTGTEIETEAPRRVNPAENYRAYNNIYAAPRPKSAPATETVPTAGYHTAAELHPGTVIVHERFGRGTIVEVQANDGGDRIIVNFFNTGRKVLMLRFARFDIV